MQGGTLPPVEWLVSPGLIPYETACTFMDDRVKAIAAGEARELVWLLEHPPLYTAGTSAVASDLLDESRFPVYRTGRGGQYTYHGPGQRVGYVMLDVGRRFGDVRAYVAMLEALVVDALGRLGVRAGTVPGRVGVWVAREPEDSSARDKIAAIGVRLRRWVSSHGFSINVAPALEHFSGIVPCGITDAGVTSLERLGLDVSLVDLDRALREAFEHRVGLTCEPTGKPPAGTWAPAAK
jgi:lipoyl(octanoyl) transferase